jgi:sialate O-acetylesterase
LEQWWHDKKTPDDLYGAMLERARRAGGTIRGLLWYQGESDAGQAGEEASSYGERFAEWIDVLRHDLQTPDLPVVIVQLAAAVRRPPHQLDPEIDRGWTQVRQAQLDLPRKVPHTACVSAIDLSMHDTVHIDGPSQNRLGHRLALVYSRLAKGQAEPTPFPVAVESARHPHPQLGMLRVRYSGVTGGIAPSHGIRGFTLRTRKDEPHPEIFVIGARVDPDEPDAILVDLNLPVTGPAELAYGYGEAPICNAVDHADLALPGFISCTRKI